MIFWKSVIIIFIILHLSQIVTSAIEDKVNKNDKGKDKQKRKIVENNEDSTQQLRKKIKFSIEDGTKSPFDNAGSSSEPNDLLAFKREIIELKNVIAKLEKENVELKNAMAKMKEENNSLGKCPICMFPFKLDDISALECGHTYHHKCIKPWIDSEENCPICRKKTKDIIPLFIDESNNELALTIRIDEIEWMNYDWNEYKFNAANCSSKMTISQEGLVLKYSGPDYVNHSARSNLPIPPFNPDTRNSIISFYYEVEILDVFESILIGFCDQQFLLEDNLLGYEKNTIGIWGKGGIWIDGSRINFGNHHECFKKGDFVGIGIIHHANSKLESFATWNGKLLGKVKLPTKYAIIQLFPTVSLYYDNDSIQVNFDNEKWQFKEFKDVFE